MDGCLALELGRSSPECKFCSNQWKTKVERSSTQLARSLGRRSRQLLSFTIDYPALHHEAHMLQRTDVLCWIARYRDHVSKIPGLERSDLPFPVEQFRAVDQIRLQNCERGHAVLDHQLELARLRAVRKGTNIRPNHHRHARGQLLFEFPGVEFLQLALTIGCRRSVSMLGKVFGDRERRHSGNALLPHDAHRLVAELKCVIDRNDTRLHSIERARLSGGMHRNPPSSPGGFLDSGGQLRLSVLVRVDSFPFTSESSPVS